MTPKNENPAPRANAGSRANSDIERNRNNSFALDWEADTAVGWLARRITMPAALARVLAALASLGGAFQ